MRVVVVGAGFAGLSAARELARRGADVVVLEARERVGGRVVNHRFSDGTVVELGGQWLGPTQDHALGLAEELGVELFATHDRGESVVSFGGRRKRFRGDTFGLPLPVLLDVGRAQKRLEAMAARVPLDAPWKAAEAREWDGTTLEAWLRRHLVFERSREFWRVVTTALFCAEASQLSLLHFLFYCRSGGMLDRLMGTRDGAQERRVVGGSQVLADRLAEELGERVRLGEPVRAIRQDADGVEVIAEGGSHRGDAVIVAIPPHLVGRIELEPALPARRALLVQSVPMGAVVKCHARYERPFWRDEGLSGFAASLDHPISIVFDNSPPDASSGVLLGFFEAEHAKRASAWDPARRREVFLECLGELIGARAREPIETVELDWAAEVWTGGCYGGHLGPGVWTQLGEELRRPFQRVFWAGTETATEWNGYIDGAISSGARAATEVLAGRSRS